ncbi:MAG: hypothetical protein MK116_13290 [Phycisphaerales bacterium]|nr:hypothetical protein [Phycisphaerales bacterium]
MRLTKTTDERSRKIPRRLPKWANAWIDITDGGPGTAWSENLSVRCCRETGIVSWTQYGYDENSDTFSGSYELTASAQGSFHVSEGFMGLARSLACNGNKYDYNGPGFSSPDLEMWQLHLLRECLSFDEYRGGSYPLLMSLTATEVRRLAEASNGLREPWVQAASSAMLHELIDDEGPDDPLEFRRELWKRFGSRYPRPEIWKEVGERKLAQLESLRQYHKVKFAEAEAERRRGPRKGAIPADDLHEHDFQSVIDFTNHPADVACRAKVFHFIKDRKLLGDGMPDATSSLLGWLLKPTGQYDCSHDQSVAQVRELVAFDPQAGRIVEQFRDRVRELVDRHDPNPPVSSLAGAVLRNYANHAVRNFSEMLEVLEDDRCGLGPRDSE